MRIFNHLSAALVAMVLVGCDGDARPFEEAVEVRAENLTSIAVVPPTISVAELVMNFDQTAQFGVQGTTVIGQTATLGSSDRDWQVTDESVASINDDGLLVAKANGSVGVFISIGGLVSDTYELRVSDATLTAVQEIVGESTIERCLPGDFQATGLYDDGSVRDLAGVNWTLEAADADKARLQNNPDTTVTVTGTNIGAATLTATLSGFSAALPIEISDSLTALEISPRSATISVDDTVKFAAFGAFTGTAPGSADADTSAAMSRPSVNITASVDWRISSANEAASVTNSVDSRGEVTGLETGIANLTASCGNLSATPVVVTINGSSDTLSFAQTSPVSLSVGNSSRTLSVSTGSTYSSSNAFDNDDLTWELSADDTSNPAISLVLNGTNAGRITPLVSGGATITVTDDEGATGSIRVEVTSN